MPAIMITIGTLADDGAEALEQYAAGTLPLLRKAGVNILGRYQGVEALAGEDLFDLLAVMEFPDAGAMRRFLASKAYASMIPYREKAFKSLRMFACNTL